MQFTVTEYQIPNSEAKGLIVNVPGAEVMSMSWCFRAGHYYAMANGYPGQLAHVLEHLLAGANQVYPTIEQFDGEFTRNGSEFNARTDENNAQHVLSCPKSDWRHALLMMRDSICRPLLTDERLSAELANIHSELSGYAMQINRQLTQILRRSTGSRMETDTDGIKSLDQITLDMVKDYYDKVYALNNMRFIVAGDFADCLDQLKTELNGFDLPNGSRQDVIRDNQLHCDHYRIYRTDAPAQTTCYEFRMLTRGDLTDEELANGWVLTRLLTGSMNSRIFGPVRRRGLAYAISSILNTSNGVGSLRFANRAETKNMVDLFDLIIFELKRLADGDLPADEVEAVKSYLIGRLPFSTQTVGGLAWLLADNYYRNDSIVQPDQVKSMLQNVSVESVVALLRKFLQSNLWGIAFDGTLSGSDAGLILDHLSALLSSQPVAVMA